MKKIKNSLLFACFISFGQFSYAQDNDINSPENKAYSNFDFLAGTKTIIYDDFSSGLNKWKIIEFDKSNDFESPGIKQIADENSNWFKTPRRGIFYPIHTDTLPQNCTIEFDMWAETEKMSEMERGLILSIVSNKIVKDEYNTDLNENPQIQIDIHPTLDILYCIATKENSIDNRTIDHQDIPNGWKQGKVHRISISRIGTHIKVYIGEKKYIDLPNGLPQKLSYTLMLSTSMLGDGIYISNFKVAEVINSTVKIDTKHKFVTNAIYFNTNSATMKPESWPVLGQAANAIKTSQSNIKIVGHTDTDGDDADNLTLSKKRAESVKSFLVENFGISPSRLLAEGEGESKPIDSNESAEGKANNRRVEFIKQ